MAPGKGCPWRLGLGTRNPESGTGFRTAMGERYRYGNQIRPIAHSDVALVDGAGAWRYIVPATERLRSTDTQ